jgi:biotin operon repressor
MPLRLLAHLGNSEAAARSIGAIAESAGVSRREVEQAVQDARLSGLPVVSSSKGLWLGTDAEALAWCERQRSRAIHLIESAQGVEKGVQARRATQEAFPWAA